MPSSNHGLSARSLAELTFVLSRVAKSVIGASATPPVEVLRQFWKSNRSVQQRWMSILDEWTAAPQPDVNVLEMLAPRILACEMAVRTFSTMMVAIDHHTESTDLTRLAHNAVKGLGQIRNALMAGLLSIPTTEADRVFGLHRLCRQNDRWTDLLLGPIALQCGFFDFAPNQERAREFGEEAAYQDSSCGPNVVDHLASAGLRLKFVERLSPQELDEPELIELMQSMLSIISHAPCHPSGVLLTRLEQRLAADRLRLECKGMASHDLVRSFSRASKSARHPGESE